MAIVHLTTQGAKASLDNGRLVVTPPEGAPRRLPLAQVAFLIVWGNVTLTTPLMGALLDRGIEVVFLTRHGRFRGRLHGHDTPHVILRRAQYAAQSKPQWVFRTAQGIVRAKLQHQRSLLQRYTRRRESVPPAVEQAIAHLQHALETAERKQTLNALRGVEGTAARAYFSGIGALFQERCRFRGRRRRPPPDPVNALLSLGYTLLAQKAQSAAQAVGLDPYAGFLHVQEYGRPALALDLMEEFRPVVDGLILKVCNQGLITPDDFAAGPPERPCILQEDGLRRFLQHFETRFSQRYLHPIRNERLPLQQCLIEQAYQLARRLREDTPGYRSMGFR